MRAAVALAVLVVACNRNPGGAKAPTCALHESLGADGPLKLRVETLAGGLEVPWSLVFLPNGDAWIAERPGRIRALRAGKLTPPIATYRCRPRVRPVCSGSRSIPRSRPIGGSSSIHE